MKHTTQPNYLKPYPKAPCEQHDFRSSVHFSLLRKGSKRTKAEAHVGLEPKSLSGPLNKQLGVSRTPYLDSGRIFSPSGLNTVCNIAQQSQNLAVGSDRLKIIGTQGMQPLTSSQVLLYCQRPASALRNFHSRNMLGRPGPFPSYLSTWS